MYAPASLRRHSNGRKDKPKRSCRKKKWADHQQDIEERLDYVMGVKDYLQQHPTHDTNFCNDCGAYLHVEDFKYHLVDDPFYDWRCHCRDYVGNELDHNTDRLVEFVRAWYLQDPSIDAEELGAQIKETIALTAKVEEERRQFYERMAEEYGVYGYLWHLPRASPLAHFDHLLERLQNSLWMGQDEMRYLVRRASGEDNNASVQPVTDDECDEMSAKIFSNRHKRRLPVLGDFKHDHLQEKHY